MITWLADVALLAGTAVLCWPGLSSRPVHPLGPSAVAGRRETGGGPLDMVWVALWAAGLVVAALVSVPLALAVGGAGVVIVRRRRHGEIRRRQRELADSLPEALDTCTVVVGAGGTVRDSIEMLAARGPVPVRAIAAESVGRADAGETFDRSLRWFQAELGPPYQPLTGALLLAQEQGGAVGLLLARLSAEASASRRRRGELRARRLPVTLLVPLVCCSLPAVLVGAVVPLALVALRDLNF